MRDSSGRKVQTGQKMTRYKPSSVVSSSVMHMTSDDHDRSTVSQSRQDRVGNTNAVESRGLGTTTVSIDTFNNMMAMDFSHQEKLYDTATSSIQRERHEEKLTQRQIEDISCLIESARVQNKHGLTRE